MLKSSFYVAEVENLNRKLKYLTGRKGTAIVNNRRYTLREYDAQTHTRFKYSNKLHYVIQPQLP